MLGCKPHLSSCYNSNSAESFIEAVYGEEGKKQVAEMVGYYMRNAKVILDGLKAAGFGTTV